MNEYRGKHAPSRPWPVASQAVVNTRRHGRHVKKNRRRRVWFILLALLIVLIIAYPFLEARMITTVKDIKAFDDLPSDANRLRIAFLSDIHWGFWFSDSDLARLISRINDLHPDIVILGGDYATDSTSAIRFFERLRTVGTIHKRYGIYGVLGETDCSESDFERSSLLEAMRAADVTPLVNQVESVNIGSGKIWLAGADDVLGGKPDLAYIARKVSASDFVIFIAHNPQLIQSAQQQTDKNGSLGWFDLGLFGHTHGGQMALFSDWLDLYDDIPDTYIRGWREENRSNMLISNGIGTSVVPCRLFRFPQIHCIELTVK